MSLSRRIERLEDSQPEEFQAWLRALSDAEIHELLDNDVGRTLKTLSDDELDRLAEMTRQQPDVDLEVLLAELQRAAR